MLCLLAKFQTCLFNIFPNSQLKKHSYQHINRNIANIIIFIFTAYYNIFQYYFIFYYMIF